MAVQNPTREGTGGTADARGAIPTTEGLWAKVGALIALTKPRVIELLLVTTIPVMILADDGLPSLWLMIATLIGGAGAAGSANALNCYIDRDIDVVMNRTKRRPLATGAITPRGALVFAVALGVAAFAWLYVLVNPLSAILALTAESFYVGIYTLVLKRRTAQNIVWGGAAGCVPVLIGWSAVTGTVGWPALILFLVVFFWTPPHYWPLAMKFRRDYAAAGVPMLPVVASDRSVARAIVWYSAAMVASSLALIPVAHTGPVYASAAVFLGGWFMWLAVGLYRRTVAEGGKLHEMKLFHGSITYLTLLFIAIAIDPFVL